MAGRVDRSFRKPVLVDEKFLTKLDTASRESLALLIGDIATEFGVNPERLTAYSNGQRIPTNLTNRYLYEQALKACKLRFTIRWRNYVTEDLPDIASVIGALEAEHSMPYSLRVRAGGYGVPHITLTITDRMDETVDLEVVGNKDAVRLIAEKVGSILANSAPDFGILHHPYTKTLLIFGAGVAWFLGLISLPQLLSNDKPISALSYFNAAGWLTAASLLFGLIFVKTFPSVVFAYGAGQGIASRKKFFFAAFGILIASIIALWIG